MRSDHPRPLLRRAWTSLDGAWDFGLSAATRPTEVEWESTIAVPFGPGTPASGIAPVDLTTARFWYRRRFDPPQIEAGQRLLVHFGAVDRLATVWANGEVVAVHEGGYTAFVADVTDAARSGDVELIVRADDDPSDLAAPRGKQDWRDESHSIWYPRTNGIWRTVWSEVVPAVHVTDIVWTCDLTAMALTATVTTTASDGASVEIKLSVGERALGHASASVAGGIAEMRILVGDGGVDDRSELQWWPRRPVLIDAEVRVGNDVVASYTALREVKVEAGQFLINGRPTFLRLVLDQGYWPDTGATPPSVEALRHDLELTRALGFNGARKHQKTEDPRYFALADELGMLVWVEMPSAYRPGVAATRALLREWTDVVLAHRNHPSVIAWVPVNESWGVPAVATDQRQRAAIEAFAAVAHALDGTRPVSVNDGWETIGGDIIGVHDYTQDAAVLTGRYRDAQSVDRVVTRIGPSARRIDLDGQPAGRRAVVLSEFGGVALTDDDRSWGYTSAADGDDLLRRYTEQWAAVHASSSLAGACWTQLTDTYQEANGLLTMDRDPKVPIERLREATRGKPERQP